MTIIKFPNRVRPKPSSEQLSFRKEVIHSTKIKDKTFGWFTHLKIRHINDKCHT